jgi:hypothetical protein
LYSTIHTPDDHSPYISSKLLLASQNMQLLLNNDQVKFYHSEFGTCFRAANYEVILLVWDGKLDGIHDHTPPWEFTESKRYQIHFQHFK